MKYEMDQVSIRMVKEPPLISPEPITGPESAVNLLGEYLRDFDRELMIVVNLRTDGKPINMNVMSIVKQKMKKIMGQDFTAEMVKEDT